MRGLTIGMVASRSGMAVSAIRFYEDKGLVRSVRTEGGQRRFRPDVLRRLAFIQVAQRVGLSLEEIKAALDELSHDGPPSEEEWRELSARWKPMLEERIRLLKALRDDLDSCIGCGCLSLQKCRLRNPRDCAGAEGPGPRHLLRKAGLC